MKRRTQHLLKVVRVMTDPEPRFVALVGAGANQTPFRKLAQAEDGTIVEADAAPTPEEKSMTDKTNVRQRSRKAGADTSNQTPEIHKMIFPVDAFTDEAAVKTYLNNHGYDIDVLEVKGAGDHWEVPGHPASDFASDLQDITVDGVTMQVGILTEEAAKALDDEIEAKSADEPAAEVTADEPAAETAAKDSDDGEVTDVTTGEDRVEGVDAVDTEVQFFTDALGFARKAIADEGEKVVKFDSVGEVITYMDDVPPGFYDLMGAFDMVVRTGVRDSDYGKIRKAARDLGEFTIQLATIFDIGSAEKATDAQKALAHKVAFLYLAARAPKEEPAAAVEEEATTDVKADTTETPVVDATAEDGKDDTKAAAEDAPAEDDAGEDKGAEATLEATLLEVMTKALAPITAKIDGIDKRVADVETAAKDREAAADSEVQPSRKGADEAPSAGDDAPKEKSFKYIDNVPDDPLWRNLLGLQ